jgi:hypothetical protein
MPLLTHTAALAGLRPVANALGLGVGRHVEPRHRDVGPLGEVGDDGVVARHLLGGDLDGAGRPDGQPIAEPVRRPHHREAEHHAEHGTASATERGADGDEEPTDAAQQDGGLEVVLHGTLRSGGREAAPMRPWWRAAPKARRSAR